MDTQLQGRAAQMRTIASTIRDDVRRMEEADLKNHIAVWKKREEQKAKSVTAPLPQIIKDVAGKGKSRLIVQVSVTEPYLTSEIQEVYKTIYPWDPRFILDYKYPDVDTDLSLYKIKRMRDGARLIVRWLLKEGFNVRFIKWDDKLSSRRLQGVDFFKFDEVKMPVIPGSGVGGWPIYEGLSVTW